MDDRKKLRENQDVIERIDDLEDVFKQVGTILVQAKITPEEMIDFTLDEILKHWTKAFVKANKANAKKQDDLMAEIASLKQSVASMSQHAQSVAEEDDEDLICSGPDRSYVEQNLIPDSHPLEMLRPFHPASVQRGGLKKAGMPGCPFLNTVEDNAYSGDMVPLTTTVRVGPAKFKVMWAEVLGLAPTNNWTERDWIKHSTYTLKCTSAR